MPQPPHFSSTAEVERKFLPTALLKMYLNSGTKPLNSLRFGEGESKICKDAAAPLNFYRLPDKRIRDTYFDSDDQLSNKGIWVRSRTSQTIRSEDFPLVSTGEPSKDWEAKVRIAGDYADSQFVEYERELKVRAGRSSIST